MDFFIIGDVHGCYHTFNEMVSKHWNSKTEMLIQLGDLMDRGRHSSKVVKFAKELKDNYPDQTVFLKGNHEYEAQLHIQSGPNENWLRQCGSETIKHYESTGANFVEDVQWLSSLPLKWENEKIYVSHAGISEKAENPFDEESEYGVLWNRDSIKNIGKLQIFGHTPLKDGEPIFNEASNSWNIDTAAFYGQCLTGIKISSVGALMEIIKLNTHAEDLQEEI